MHDFYRAMARQVMEAGLKGGGDAGGESAAFAARIVAPLVTRMCQGQ